MRLLSVILGLAAFFAMIYFAILFWGIGRSHPRFEHSFTALPKPLVFLSWDSPSWLESVVPAATVAKPLTSTKVDGNSTNAESSHASRRAGAIPWFEVYQSQDGTLRALPSRFRPQPQDLLPKNIGNEGPPLKEAIAEYLKNPGVTALSPIAFQIHSNVDGIQDQFEEELIEFKLKNVMVQSEFDNIMGSIKTNRALWIFGTSAADRVRWMTYSSLGLAPAVTYTGDVYYSPMKVRKIEALNSDMTAEVKRRGLLLILGPLNSNEDVLQAKKFEADGYLVDSLDQLD